MTIDPAGSLPSPHIPLGPSCPVGSIGAGSQGFASGQCDVFIVGAGYVGCALALALEPLGLTVALLDPQPMRGQPGPQWDVRVFTISPGAEALLRGQGVWARLDATRLASVYRMIVHGDDATSVMHFDAMSAGVPHLGTVVEGGRLQAALEAEICARNSIGVLAPAAVQSLDWSHGAVRVRLQDGREIRTGLLVGADGTHSLVRTRAGIDLDYKGYGQTGVVANFEAEIPHGGRAFQWFRKDGVLAFLPLPGQLMSIVWSARTDYATGLLQMGSEAFSAAVEEASGLMLGRLKLISPVQGFPLRLARARSMVGPRLALVGDAAHSVHPLAGQGVNLGFRDVEALSALLKERPPDTDVAEVSMLAKYQRMRLQDTMSIYGVTDGLHHLFGSSNPVVRAIRNRGLGLMDSLSLAKLAMIRAAMQ